MRLRELRANYVKDILDLKKNIIEEIIIIKEQAFYNEENLKIMQYGLTRNMRDFIDEAACNNTRRLGAATKRVLIIYSHLDVAVQLFSYKILLVDRY